VKKRKPCPGLSKGTNGESSGSALTPFIVRPCGAAQDRHERLQEAANGFMLSTKGYPLDRRFPGNRLIAQA
jgi:hypothetical protein